MRSELDANLKEAIKSQEKQRVATLRLINAAIKDRDIAVRSEENTEGVSDAEIILILSNMVKQRKQSIIQYEEGGRVELAERELIIESESEEVPSVGLIVSVAVVSMAAISLRSKSE